MAGLSPYYVSRLFCRETGFPPTRYLGAMRLEAARRRLLCSQASVADISVEVGCASLGTFTTRFNRILGVPPGRYRRHSLLGEGGDGFGGALDGWPFLHASIMVTAGDRGPQPHALHLTAIPAAEPSADEPGGAEPGGGGPVRFCSGEHPHRGARLAHVPPGQWYVAVRPAYGECGPLPAATTLVGPLRTVPGAVVPIELDWNDLKAASAERPHRGVACEPLPLATASRPRRRRPDGRRG
ncbi:helix-turn-helix transcriptional regulator [Actinomadura sp. WMMB 499]|uniref:helix-turn-helix transcriptional regulator n=1 Tax=Actinomadura sp. WMMB 499 TaxID=1219491 RepID=UPI00159E791B|nr:helix-turn-helix transcriptional regulator [Actinomadura sp. WMMB 499]